MSEEKRKYKTKKYDPVSHWEEKKENLMTVKEVISQLEKLPEDSLVVSAKAYHNPFSMELNSFAIQQVSDPYGAPMVVLVTKQEEKPVEIKPPSLN